MYTDPQSVTINSVTKSLPRVKNGEMNSTYVTADGEYQLRISHQTSKKRIRRMIRLDHTKIAEDPLTAVNAQMTAGIYLVIDEPSVGFTDAELVLLYNGFGAYIAQESVRDKLLGGES